MVVAMACTCTSGRPHPGILTHGSPAHKGQAVSEMFTLKP